MNIILASSSPRRKLILQNLLELSEIYHPQIDESVLPGESPRNYAERISEEKAKSVIPLTDNSRPALIISCDTIVTINNQIIGKPVDLKDAIKIIKTLTGKAHEVISSITLLYLKKDEILKRTGSEITSVTFKNLSEKEIIYYLKKTDYRDKAGAYAVQESGNLIIKKTDGSITNVIGFPLRLFFKMLIEIDLFKIIFF